MTHEEAVKILCSNPVLGVRFNVVRRPLSGGVGNIRPHQAKATKTSYTPKESDEHFYERLRKDYIAKDPAYWFFRVRAGITSGYDSSDVEVFCRTCLDPLLETVCWWYGQVTGAYDPHEGGHLYRQYAPMNYRTPFGIYNTLGEGGATEYDAYLDNGSEAGLRRVEELFTELK